MEPFIDLTTCCGEGMILASPANPEAAPKPTRELCSIAKSPLTIASKRNMVLLLLLPFVSRRIGLRYASQSSGSSMVVVNTVISRLVNEAQIQTRA